MRMIRWPIAMAAALLLMGGAVVALADDPASVERTPGTGSVMRIRTFKVGPSAFCGGDSCGISSRGFDVPTPDSARMTMIVTVSFDYVTSADDTATMGVAIGRRRPLDPLQPRSRTLVPTTTSMSTTLVWSGHDIRAGGRDISVSMGVTVPFGGHREVSTGHMTVVVEMVPR